MIDLTSFNRIESYYDNYKGICSEDEKQSLIKQGFLPGRLFVPWPNGDVIFYYWAVGSEDMNFQIIPPGSLVQTPPQWENELKELGLRTEVVNRQPVSNKGTILSY